MLITTSFTYGWRTAALTFIYSQPRLARWAWLVAPFSPILLGLVVGGVWVIAGFGSAVVLVWATRQGVKRMLDVGPIDVQLTDYGYSVAAKGRSGSFAWWTVDSIRRTRGLWVFEASGRALGTLPEAALTAEENAHLQAFVDEQLRRAPRHA